MNYLWQLARLGAKKYGMQKAEERFPAIKSFNNETFGVKSLNVHEDEVVRYDIANPYSPMYKDVSTWDDFDFQRATLSPSYKYNYKLQSMTDEYLRIRQKRNGY